MDVVVVADVDVVTVNGVGTVDGPYKMAVNPAHRAVSLHKLRKCNLSSVRKVSAAACNASNCGKSVHLSVHVVAEEAPEVAEAWVPCFMNELINVNTNDLKLSLQVSLCKH